MDHLAKPYYRSSALLRLALLYMFSVPADRHVLYCLPGPTFSLSNADCHAAKCACVMLQGILVAMAAADGAQQQRTSRGSKELAAQTSLCRYV